MNNNKGDVPSIPNFRDNGDGPSKKGFGDGAFCHFGDASKNNNFAI